MSKVPGRPPKKRKGLDLTEKSSIFNINENNDPVPKCGSLFPITTGMVKNNIVAVFITDKSAELKKIMDVIKNNLSLIWLKFDRTGITLMSPVDDKVVSMTYFICKIFASDLNIYCVCDNQEHIFAAQTSSLHLLMRNVNDGKKIKITITETNKMPKLLFECDISTKKHMNSNDRGHGHIELERISKNQNIFNYQKEDYIITIINGDSFANYTKKVGTISNLIDLTYKNRKITYVCKKEEPHFSIVQKQSKQMHIIQGIDKSYIGTFHAYSLTRYIKVVSISNIVKLYMSNEHKLIIEMDIGLNEPIGLIQIHVKEANKIEL